VTGLDKTSRVPRIYLEEARLWYQFSGPITDEEGRLMKGRRVFGFTDHSNLAIVLATM